MRMPRAATTKARTGAMSAGTMSLSTSPVPLIAPVPAATRVAPTTPPISAWEDEDGRPKYQVTRFQAIAPIKPAKTIVSVIASWSTKSLAIVAATAREMNAPTKFRTEARATAIRGGMARVEIDVATTFAVSWKPFVKSKASAVTTTITRTMSLSTSRSPGAAPAGASRVLDHDVLEDVRDGLRGVDSSLEAIVDVLPANHHHGVDAVLEQPGQGLPHEAIALVLEPVQLDGEVVDVTEVAHPRHRLLQLAAGLKQHA